MNQFLPVSVADMEERGWDSYDFLIITGDAYVDHPSFGPAIISRVLEAEGYRVAILAQPDWRKASSFTALGRPRLGVMLSSGNIDSMVAHYTVAKKRRHDDAYSPGNRAGLRPDRAVIVYANKVREAFGDIPLIIGGLEASLRRFAHYDYWEDKVRRAVLFDSQADLLVYGMGERATREIAARLTTGRLICIDRDQAAIDAAQDRLAPWLARVTLIHSNFSELKEVLSRCGVSGADGMLFDLGVSSPQLDDASRGFSYMQDAPLDMRMDTSAPLSAADIVNTWSQEELRRILWQYGEERYAPAVAGAIVRARDKQPIETTLALVDVIKSALPPAALREKQHPAKRTFQAIRIAVNDELGAVDKMVQRAVPRLNPGGRLAVISFHSLEDRIVKNGLAAFAKGCTCPPDFPVCVCGKKPQIRLITRKPIVSGPEELEENPRARSAKLRVAEKL